MAKEDGVRTVVIGGKQDVPQDYCGTVGGQSTDFATIDTEIKVSSLFASLTVLIYCNLDCEAKKPFAGATRLVHIPVTFALPRAYDFSLHSLTNSVQGITWRLGFGIDQPSEPEGI